MIEKAERIFNKKLKDELITTYPNISKEFLKKLEKRGILLQAVRKGRTFRLLPMYIIKKEEIDFFIYQLEICLSEIKSEYHLA